MSGGVCVVGSFMMDLVASAPRRPLPGETLVGTDFGTYLGGKGFNQAVAAVRAGATTYLVGRLGSDEFGTSFREAMRIENVQFDGVVVDAEVGTGVGLPVVEPDGQNSIIIVPRANLRVDVQQIESARQTLTDAAVLLLQLELPVGTALAAARTAHGAGTVVVLNPAPSAPLPGALLDHVDVVVPNEVELLDLAGLPGADVGRAAMALHRQWGTDVVVTLGSRGVLVLTGGDEPRHVPAHHVTALDTVGAGDTFCGYLGAGLADGRPLLDAVVTANAAAAIAVTRRGGAEAAPRRHEVQAFLEVTWRRVDGRLPVADGGGSDAYGTAATGHGSVPTGHSSATSLTIDHQRL
ncbi:ribokinase [Cellulomonas sp. KRMCY2]|uniref:ribokinase n=1 Tax=Cellulomonas sp. KRMCY2 TaxID=1304865 RepID=UPI00045E9E88|nr:ribokinase [Cellulomonas sp. KRMCY2]